MLIEVPELYDGWIEMLCHSCKNRIGRWSGKILENEERENPDLRFGHGN